MTFQTGKQIEKRRFVLGESAVKNREQFYENKEDADGQRVGHDFCQCLNRFFSRVKITPAPEKQADDYQQRRPEAKAEARNLGAMMAVSQKFRPGRPA